MYRQGVNSSIGDNESTALGSYFSRIPTDLQCGKLLVHGAISACPETCLTVKSQFVTLQAREI